MAKLMEVWRTCGPGKRMCGSGWLGPEGEDLVGPEGEDLGLHRMCSILSRCVPEAKLEWDDALW